MSKEIEISQEEKLDILIEQIKAILTESVFSARMTLIEGKHLIGKTIAEDPLYRKWGKGTGGLIEEIAKRIGRSERDIYLCVQFYKQYPKIERLVQTLKGKKNDITWAATRRLLEGKGEERCEHKLRKITCWQCKICQKIFKNKPE